MGERELLLTIITRGKPQVESLTVFEASQVTPHQPPCIAHGRGKNQNPSVAYLHNVACRSPDLSCTPFLKHSKHMPWSMHRMRWAVTCLG